MELNGYQKYVLKELKDYVGAVREKAGFSRNDYRVAAVSAQPPAPALVQPQLEERRVETGVEDLDATPEEATIQANSETPKRRPSLNIWLSKRTGRRKSSD